MIKYLKPWAQLAHSCSVWVFHFVNRGHGWEKGIHDPTSPCSVVIPKVLIGQEDSKCLCFSFYVFGREDEKVEWLKININFFYLVGKKIQGWKEVLYLNLLPCPY